jgi:hypothetical protein
MYKMKGKLLLVLYHAIYINMREKSNSLAGQPAAIMQAGMPKPVYKKYYPAN